MKRFLLIFSVLITLCLSAHSQATQFSDLKFGKAQFSDAQWDVGACMYSTVCNIYGLSGIGTSWNLGYPVNIGSTQYIAFNQSGNANNPWQMKLYNSNGSVAQDLGIGKLAIQGSDNSAHNFFFFTNDNWNGTVFSLNYGFANSNGFSFGVNNTGISSPTVSQTNTFATSGSTAPLAAGQTTAPAGPPPPAPTAIHMDNATVKITRAIPTTSNSPSNEGPNNAFDNNPNTKYLNFDKKNAGVTIQLNSGRAVTGFTVTTANDYSGRDPTSYKLYGSNDGATWTLVKQDAIALSDSRYTTSAVVDVANSTAYAYYFMVFPTTKAGDGCGQNCNSMQIAELTYYYDANSTTTSTATNSTIVDPVTAAANTLCCGGTSAAFSANLTNTAKVMSFVNRTTADSRVTIEQIGTQNIVSVDQDGTKNNYVNYYGSGLSNSIDIKQQGNSSTDVNYIDLRVVGNFNTVKIEQTSTAGGKGAFVNIQDNNNSLTLKQQDSGSHYAEVNLSGGNKTVDILQQGSAGHMASVTLTGPQPSSLNLIQAGATQQFYSIVNNCTTAGGCAPISVTQGK